jgi:hypothetical protein
LVKLYSPKDEIELALIQSLLIGEGIEYFVHNEHFGSLKVGLKVPLYNAKTIIVDEEDIDWAGELLSDFLKYKQDPEYSLPDKIRLVLEAILFTWIMPGRRWPKRGVEGD